MGMIANFLRVSESELNDYLKDSSLLADNIYSDEENSNLTDIDKSWGGILFLLTGQGLEELEHPLTRILFSGELIDEDQDLGYGPAHYLTVLEVKEIYNEISKITPEELRGRYDAEKMEELGIYPNIWDDDQESLDYLLDSYNDVLEVYSEAVKNNQAIITFIN
jgi:hypothetical protein